MMMGFGFLFMLAVLAILILLVVGAAVWMMKQSVQPTRPPAVNPPNTAKPAVVPPAPSASAGRACSHCGAGLQPDWTHCPQCGAPAS